MEHTPSPPDGVRYVLTVPQSVLFTELSMKGNLSSRFAQVFGFDYEPSYICYDNGDISWEVEDRRFEQALFADGAALSAVQRFISVMESTSRVLDKVSRIVSAQESRRLNVEMDLAEDLNEYWDAYKSHMTNLFTFWCVESILDRALKEASAKHENSIRGIPWLSDCVRPSEMNYFALEQSQLQKLKRRFIANSDEKNVDSLADLNAALTSHAEIFGFILQPFNIGGLPSIDKVRSRLLDLHDHSAGAGESAVKSHAGLPNEIYDLIQASRRLAFWKTERLDVCWLCDSRAQPLYKEACKRLEISPDQLMAMTSDEVLLSIGEGSLMVDKDVLTSRLDGYCIVLSEGDIRFYQGRTRESVGGSSDAAEPGTLLTGDGASPGRATGRARVINSSEDWTSVQHGEILVAVMTRPEMGAALDRAAAFVTDQGGLLCHAAVIARQYGKPAVVATEHATAVIRTGMLLTIDGHDGTVRVDSSAESVPESI